MSAAPVFDAGFRTRLAELMCWRRDVRRFLPDPVPADTLRAILASLDSAPSVGLSQPWRIVRVESEAVRARVADNFRAANATAMTQQADERADLYASLKLAGLDEAPEHLAVFCEPEPDQGHGLGRVTMPETVHASAVCAIMQMWLMARAYGIGVGWVSILDPVQLAQDLDVPNDWLLVAYLCLGRPAEERSQPELEIAGWERRRAQCAEILTR